MTHILLRSLFALSGLLLAANTTASPDVPDTMEQRLASCAKCHGEFGYGLENNPTIPRLAEKPAGYLYKQMLSIKAGEGQSKIMEYTMRLLSTDYMRKIAHYYAEQQVPYHEQIIPTMTEAQLKRGEQLVKEGDLARGVPACAQCHGAALTGVKPMIPGIINQPFDYMVTQLELWRSNKRSVESTHCMWVVANRLMPTDVKAVAAWLAVQPIPEQREPIMLADLPEDLPGWCELGEDEVGL